MLLTLMVLMVALPRAGIFITQVRLPLPFAHLLAAILIGVWLLRLHRKQEYDRVNYFFLAYGLIACWGLGLGIATGGSVLYAFLEASFYFFIMGLFFYLSDTFRERSHFHLFLGALLFIGLAVSLYGLAQCYWGDSILIKQVTYNSATEKARAYVANEPQSRRILSSYGDPNVLASQLVLFGAVGLAVLIGRGKITFRHRVLWLAALLVSTTCLYYTRSRAGMIAMGIITTILLAWRTRWVLLLALTALIYLVFIDAIPLGGLMELLPENDVRREFPNWAMQFIKGAPLGCGFGNSVAIHTNHHILDFVIIPATTIWMGFNSFWLDLLSRIGLPGTLAFALLLAALFYRMLSDIRKIHDPYVKAALVGGILGLFGQTLIWLANNTYILPGGGLTFWFQMGMFYAGARAYKQESYPVWALPQNQPYHWSAATALPR